MMKRTAITLITLATLFVGGALDALGEGATVIKITAKKFEFSPKEITLKQGQTVTLQVTTTDSKHGISIPSMDLRADVLPGKVTELKITPKKVGKFDFYCDVFCGDGHDDMGGKIIVTP